MRLWKRLSRALLAWLMIRTTVTAGQVHVEEATIGVVVADVEEVEEEGEAADGHPLAAVQEVVVAAEEDLVLTPLSAVRRRTRQQSLSAVQNLPGSAQLSVLQDLPL